MTESTPQNSPFPFTCEGYMQAKAYLKSIDKWTLVSDKDGYTITATANSYMQEEVIGERSRD